MWAYVLIPLLFPYILLTIKVSLYIVKPLSFLLRLSSSFLSTIKFSPIGKTGFIFSLMETIIDKFCLSAFLDVIFSNTDLMYVFSLCDNMIKASQKHLV